MADGSSDVNGEDVLDDLLDRYDDLLLAFGPDSSEAAQFLEEHNWHAEFVELANTTRTLMLMLRDPDGPKLF